MLRSLLISGIEIDYNNTHPGLTTGSFSNKFMIKLTITVLPKRTKYLEFSQSLGSMMPVLKQLCASMKVSEKNKEFTIIINVDSVKRLTATLQSKEFSILSGAIRTLGEKSDIVVHGQTGAYLKELRLSYSKKLVINEKL